MAYFTSILESFSQLWKKDEDENLTILRCLSKYSEIPFIN